MQATDQYVGARNATIVLHDNDGVRATMTAHWLLQMGWNDTYVLDHKPGAAELTTEAEPRYPAGFCRADSCNRGRRRAAHVARHDPGDRSRHQPQLSRRPCPRRLVRRARRALRKTHPGDAEASRTGATRIVLVSPDGEIAALAPRPKRQRRPAACRSPVLEGGMKAWRDAKLPVETGHVRMADPPTDVWYRPYDFKEDVEAAMRQYLDWEVDLVPPGGPRRRCGLLGLKALIKMA